MRYLAMLVSFAIYMFGIILAKGSWSTFFAIVFFPYAWYLSITQIAKSLGLL
ncbi:hypothetical protein Acj9p072 [Acinetobacter phage Acj9]|uniref:Uncharacterized protein n=1 Tax=Acinetobacter phage Acj9 TaxID=760939 RepID=E5EPK6_9CAUD|nr:hypothetical protein Acj9p072 [Acinetobacter phage Acj9]ADG59972.1 hypothetical protein Acj9p072 [Acinetobacter phage Acj9]